jgi:hypothetical protein
MNVIIIFVEIHIIELPVFHVEDIFNIAAKCNPVLSTSLDDHISLLIETRHFFWVPDIDCGVISFGDQSNLARDLLSADLKFALLVFRYHRLHWATPTAQTLLSFRMHLPFWLFRHRNWLLTFICNYMILV